MRSNLHFQKKFLSGISILLAFSFFTASCHTGSEVIPAAPATVKKAEAGSRNLPETATAKLQKSTPETPVKYGASGILLPETGKQTVSGISVADANAEKACERNALKAVGRNPFAMPAALEAKLSGKKQTATATQPPSSNPSSLPALNDLNALNKTTAPQYDSSGKKLMSGTPASVHRPEPYISGIFDNGQERFILLHWDQIQGIFRSGETLGNGYYVREISDSQAVLCTNQEDDGRSNVTLKLR
ncbi:MAG: hypothetical protein IJ657_02620 [Acidaminococcaceae bacterium]|nr:hypothetical protein [Acidaminococcaceae bacterium]